MTNVLHENERANIITHVRDDDCLDKSDMIKMEKNHLIHSYVEAGANKAFCWIGQKLGEKTQKEG